MGNSERRDAATEFRCPNSVTGADSEPRRHRRQGMGTMGNSYSGSRSYSRSRGTWRWRGITDSDAAACPKSRLRRIGSRLFSSHPESR